MIQERKQGRALQLDGLLDSQVKVTLGFKCEPNVKMTLATESQNYGMSLSEYVETIVNNRNQKNASSTQPQPSQNTNTAELHNLRKENATYKEKLNFFYNNILIRRAFEQYKGQNIKYNTSNGVSKTTFIGTIEDVYKVLIEISNLS